MRSSEGAIESPHFLHLKFPTMYVNIKLKKGAQMPRKAHNTDAAFDLYAHWIEEQDGMLVIGTGVHIEVPNGHVGLVFPRSSIAKTNLRLANCVGVIDPGYTGEILAKYDMLYNPEMLRYDMGDRCAQILFVKTLDVHFAEVEELAETNRGDGGYGSTNEPVHFTVKMEEENAECNSETNGMTEDEKEFIAKHPGVLKTLQTTTFPVREIAKMEDVSMKTVMKMKKILFEKRFKKPINIEQPFTEGH